MGFITERSHHQFYRYNAPSLLMVHDVPPTLTNNMAEATTLNRIREDLTDDKITNLPEKMSRISEINRNKAYGGAVLGTFATSSYLIELKNGQEGSSYIMNRIRDDWTDEEIRNWPGKTRRTREFFRNRFYGGIAIGTFVILWYIFFVFD